MSYNPGPTPPYTNPPIQPYFFQPNQFFISAITMGQTTIVTTTVNLNYVIGQSCRLLIPQANGCSQLSGIQGVVISVPNPNQVELTIDSSFINPFLTTTLTQQPQIVAIGDFNSGSINSNGLNSIFNYIPGSFINISP